MRRKHERSIKVLAMRDDGKGIIRITQDGKGTEYFIAPLPNDYGPAWTLEKWDDEEEATTEEYHVCLDDHGYSTCDCRGHERYGFCKHREGLEALAKAGKLTCRAN